MRLLVARLLGLAHTLTLSALPNSPRSRSETPRARCSGTLELRSEMQASRDVMASGGLGLTTNVCVNTNNFIFSDC